MIKPLTFTHDNVEDIWLCIKQAGSLTVAEKPHTPNIETDCGRLVKNDGTRNDIVAYSYYIATFYFAESRWPKKEEMGKRMSDGIYLNILKCAYSILMDYANTVTIFDAPLNFYPKESHKQWLKDKNMTHAVFMELIQDEEATRNTFSDAKQGYKFMNI